MLKPESKESGRGIIHPDRGEAETVGAKRLRRRRRRRKGRSPESGALHGLLRFPSCPSYQCSHGMTWSGASDTSSLSKLYWFSSMWQ
ncbi:uncharacterized [Tachysurus ichikawai]